MHDTLGSLQIDHVARRYAAGDLTVAQVAEAVLHRIAAAGEDNVWIFRLPADAVRARAAELDRLRQAEPDIQRRLPLFGIPFAVKDNIDVAGYPTTAACPAFAYLAERSATVVERLVAAGALLVGKTNLDQFATGLVGTRSPYGVARNPFDPAYVPGGSSAGSAVAVSSGLVSFSLGTDTAGSGRVPAAFNNIVGLKPSCGLISTRGVVPACRSLDCVSIFALTSADALAVLDVAAGFDAEDPYSRQADSSRPALPARFRFGVPAREDLNFFGNADAARLYGQALETLSAMGGERVEIDFAPFRETANLLYSGPWVAERLAATEAIVSRTPEALLPVTRGIIAGGARYSAVDTFRALYRLAELRQRALPVWDDIDVLVVPSAGTIPTIAEVEAEPVQCNSDLGLYTNFVNLLDLAAHAVPCGFQGNGLPAGITLIAPAFTDTALAGLARDFHRRRGLPLGATGHLFPEGVGPEDVGPEDAPPPAATTAEDGLVPLAVFGAHMRGMALDRELIELGAAFREAVRTAPCYRLFALAGGAVARPGLVRVAEGAGALIEAEIWAMTPAALGRFLVRVAPPLCIGSVLLEDGRTVKGFLCEPIATAAARDITGFGGWRGYRAASA